MMKLKSLIKDLEYVTESEFENMDIKKVSVDSRHVENGDLFVAISGPNQDGHDYIKEAHKRGASAVILERDVDIENLKKIKVRDTRKALALLARNLYQDPSKKIRTIGITGTNGKTTISYLLESILKTAGHKVGVIGTIKYKIGDEIIEADNTTPSSLVLQKLIRRMVDGLLNYCVMEVSSHALDQHRADNIDFDMAVFTNATSEHLDYHKNFENYLDSKMELFRGLKRNGIAILNMDDPNFYMAKEFSASKRIISFGLNRDADIYADTIELNIDGSAFAIHTENSEVFIKSHLTGMHNVSNMLAAASCAIQEGIDPGVIKEGLESVRIMPGRLQLVEGSGSLKVFVDYAHTDDALKKVLATLNGLKQKKLITVFGCGGNRDREKRPRMGDVATKLSDYTIITSDNPRYEDPDKIIDDITKGIGRGVRNFKVVPDRRRAIGEAISCAKGGDIVLIAGKGHEKYQITKGEKISFDDVEVAKEFLRVKKRCLV